MKQVYEEICDGFMTHESIVNNRLFEFEQADRRRDEWVASLESTAATFDKSFREWKPKVDSSLTSVKLELSKLNSFFDHDAEATSTQSPASFQSCRRLCFHPSVLALMALMSTAPTLSTRNVGMGVYTPRPMTRSRVHCCILLHPRIPHLAPHRNLVQIRLHSLSNWVKGIDVPWADFLRSISPNLMARTLGCGSRVARITLICMSWSRMSGCG
jgi:hypothetical protein